MEGFITSSAMRGPSLSESFTAGLSSFGTSIKGVLRDRVREEEVSPSRSLCPLESLHQRVQWDLNQDQQNQQQQRPASGEGSAMVFWVGWLD